MLNEIIDAINHGGETHLCFKNCGLSDYDASQIAVALSQNDVVLSLDLSRNDVTDQGAQALAEMIKTNKRLRALKLRQNQLSLEGVVAFHEALRFLRIPRNHRQTRLLTRQMILTARTCICISLTLVGKLFLRMIFPFLREDVPSN